MGISCKKFICLIVSAYLISVVMLCSFCSAATVTLSWDANTESDLAGYKVYYQADSSGLPFQGTGAFEGAAPVEIYNQTTATISGLDPGRTYYFAVTAYNTSGMESSYSNIVTVFDTVPPAVSLINPDTTGFNLSDALLALQIGAVKVAPTLEQLTRLDVAPVVNGISMPDGAVNTGDAIVILSKIVKPAL